MSYSGVGEVQIQVRYVIQWYRGGSNASEMSYSGVGEVQDYVIHLCRGVLQQARGGQVCREGSHRRVPDSEDPGQSAPLSTPSAWPLCLTHVTQW